MKGLLRTALAFATVGLLGNHHALQPIAFKKSPTPTGGDGFNPNWSGGSGSGSSKRTKRGDRSGRTAMPFAARGPGIIGSIRLKYRGTDRGITRFDQLCECAAQAKAEKRRLAKAGKGRNGKLLGLRPDLA